MTTVWGDEESTTAFAVQCFGERPADAPTNDPSFLKWLCRMARFSATPVGAEAFESIWFATDIAGHPAPGSTCRRSSWPMRTTMMRTAA